MFTGWIIDELKGADLRDKTASDFSRISGMTYEPVLSVGRQLKMKTNHYMIGMMTRVGIDVENQKMRLVIHEGIDGRDMW